MADILSMALTELEGHILTMWPDVTAQIYDETTRRINWRLLLEDGHLVVPFGVIQLGQATGAEGFSLRNQEFKLPISVHYIRSSSPTAAETAANEKVFQDVMDRCQTLADYIYIDAGNNMTNLQTLEEPFINIGPQNPVNEVFIEASAPYVAGSVEFNLHIGKLIT